MSQNSLVILNRILLLKENSPFLLFLDTLAQTSRFLIDELASKNNEITFMSFETINRPPYVLKWVDCHGMSEVDIIKETKTSAKQQLVIIDSLNYFSAQQLVTLVLGIISQPGTILAGVYHTDGHPKEITSTFSYYPSDLSLLCYIASTILEVEPILSDSHEEEALEMYIQKLQYPVHFNLHSPKFAATLHHRRKSGRTLTYRYIINAETHVYEVQDKNKQVQKEDDGLLKDLTTFNLSTSVKQKAAREQVELPFLQAQEALGSAGGAIVYEFEKDDDYDEEDPYEDPF